MFNFIKRLFGKDNSQIQARTEFTEEEISAHDTLKIQGLEQVLGKMHDLVGHAIIPFAVGGAVDMYYFPYHIKGTGFATMELLYPDGNGPKPNRLGTYELVAFTRHDYDSNEEEPTSFNLIERKVCGMFTTIGFFSKDATLNPNETCEIPNADGADNTCVVFDLYEPDNKKFMIGDKKHHLLLCLQIFRSEMEYARENGSEALFEKLRQAGHYPYSDLDRQAVA
jgi:hypothetical protein